MQNQPFRNAFATIVLVGLGPVLALITFLVFGPLTDFATTQTVRVIFLLDAIYILVLAALVMREIARSIAMRRARSAGARLHLRLIGVFTSIALLPTVIVAVFATITVNIGLEAWFSDRVSQALGNSLNAALSYQDEQRNHLLEDALDLSQFINSFQRAGMPIRDNALRQILAQGQLRIQRGLDEAFIIDASGDIISRGENSYLFDYDRPTDAELQRAQQGDIVLISDRQQDEFRALVPLQSLENRYLFISRVVEGNILSLLDETEQTVGLYRQIEAERGRVLFNFALLYIGFALIIIMAAILLGLWFAERLSRPIGQLAAAAQAVGKGDLNTRVAEDGGKDEIFVLQRIFNQMTAQLKGQRDALITQHEQTEHRRRLFDSVLGSVTAGVIGLDRDGRIEFTNRAAMRLLALPETKHMAVQLGLAVPEFADLFARLSPSSTQPVQDEIRILRDGKQENLLVRMAPRQSGTGLLEGYVIAFDDVTQLVSAQRMAAWGDVARRIAHEIKNPLTPIQLSAERIKRKFGPSLTDENADALAQLTQVIIRQTDDLRRIVDEFSKFARMPEPQTKIYDLGQVFRDAITLLKAGQPDVTFAFDVPDGPVNAMIDAAMIGQALTNLIKNAGEAIESLIETGPPQGYCPELRGGLRIQDGIAVIEICDNGIGLPQDRSRLFEPYVTTRAKGTGLGLPIVKKIIEEHGGTLELRDAAPFAPGAHCGAMAQISLPIISEDPVI